MVFLLTGRPADGFHWQTSLQQDFAFTPDKLREYFFDPHWEDIVLGRAGLMEHLPVALKKIAPHVNPASFLSYWLENDSRLYVPLLQELAAVRSTGIWVYLATNQEHLRADYLMRTLGLAEYVDGVFYSAILGVNKPDTELFYRVQASVGLRGEELFLIDDSAHNVSAALEAGWRALLWTRSSSPSALRRLCQ